MLTVFLLKIGCISAKPPNDAIYSLFIGAKHPNHTISIFDKVWNFAKGKIYSLFIGAKHPNDAIYSYCIGVKPPNHTIYSHCIGAKPIKEAKMHPNFEYYPIRRIR